MATALFNAPRSPFPSLRAPPIHFSALPQYLSRPAIRIIAVLAVVNILVWIAVAIILHAHPLLASSAVLAYTFGLRHALDADHIAAIDLMTRRLLAAGTRPVTVGTWFSLGHSTIVVITCIVVAATSGALEQRFEGFERVGNVVGTAVSATVLLLLGIANAWILVKLVQRLRRVMREEVGGDAAAVLGEGRLEMEGGGILMRIFRKAFKVVDRPWKMYFVGVLFGLGFDTSSEVAVIGIAALQGAQGTSIWLILIFPVLFTAGMCLIDTCDGALMMTLYTSTSLAHDTVAILYYSIVLTTITVIVAICIGIIQLLSLVAGVANPTGTFWDGVNSIGDHFDIVGGAICGSFIVFGILSVILYRPWRKRLDRRRRRVSLEGNEMQNIESKGTDDKRIGTVEDSTEIHPGI